MICECGEKKEIIEETLNHLLFKPIHTKSRGTGVHGIKANICRNCGRLFDFHFEKEEVKRLEEDYLH